MIGIGWENQGHVNVTIYTYTEISQVVFKNCLSCFKIGIKVFLGQTHFLMVLHWEPARNTFC